MNKYKQLLEQVLNEETYKEFFKKALAKYKIKSPKDLKSDKEKKEFFDYIEKNWKAKDE